MPTWFIRSKNSLLKQKPRTRRDFVLGALSEYQPKLFREWLHLLPIPSGKDRQTVEPSARAMSP